ncbi:MAG TPA: hypothetical protein VLK30_13095, partial [Candidatus Limnocylindrales bacterium]|nr:hypothetical protein [Candidatus Limnocylindrales bacterium]
MNGTLAVTRYTLLELSRRRVLLVFFLLGFLGIIALAVGLKILASILTNSSSQTLGLQFAVFITGVLRDFGLLIAYGIGMTAIYHDLDSGAAVSIFSKPVSRLAFAAGKILAAAIGLVVIVGLLAAETGLVTFLFGGGYQDTIDSEILAVVANMIVVVLILLALTTWMNNIVAALVAFVYYNVLASAVVSSLHALVVSGEIENAPARAVIDTVYWFFPHPLTSDIPAALLRAGAGEGGARGPLGGGLVLSASGPGDIAW